MFRVCFVSVPAQVELKSGRVSAPAELAFLRTVFVAELAEIQRQANIARHLIQRQIIQGRVTAPQVASRNDAHVSNPRFLVLIQRRANEGLPHDGLRLSPATTDPRTHFEPTSSVTIL